MAKATSYLGKVPKAGARLPAGLPRTPADATKRMSGSKPAPSRASTPRVSPNLANAGFGAPPRAAGGGVPKATTSMASAPSKRINKPKTGSPRRGRRIGRPRASISSKI